MALKKTPKPAAEPEATDIQLIRQHPSNPILVTEEDILENPTRIQIRTPRPLVIRGGASNRLDLCAQIFMPENVTAEVKPLGADAHQKGYTVSSDMLHSGDEVTMYFRNHSIRTVQFDEGSVVGVLVFQRHRPMTVEIDCALPPIPEKKLISRAGKVPEGELPFET